MKYTFLLKFQNFQIQTIHSNNNMVFNRRRTKHPD